MESTAATQAYLNSEHDQATGKAPPQSLSSHDLDKDTANTQNHNLGSASVLS